MTQNSIKKIESSFRDPSGFVYRESGVLYRRINKSYAENYSLLMESGLYEELTRKELLVEHSEVPCNCDDPSCFACINPTEIPFVSYPYEWTFSQLKDAALATLVIQKIAMKHGMSLKDASSFNIQFSYGKPVLIDTLSFEKLDKKKPWVAYRQFCQNFLAPLALMSYKDARLIQLLRVFIDGIPLDLTSSLLPKKSYLNLALLMHIHTHAKTQKYYGGKKIEKKNVQMNKYALEGLISSLTKTISKLQWKKADTEWGEYYSFTNYSRDAFRKKKEIIESFIDKLSSRPKSVWDLGGNTGLFSRISSEKNIPTISFDIDYLAVEKNYRQMKKNGEKNILPLFLDLTNPPADLGWAHQERDSLAKRGPADLVFALALIHHISISNNVPFEKVASYFSKICKNLIIEFVPKDDSQVQKLLSTREDIFTQYNQENFEDIFGKFFEIISKQKIKGSARTLYLMKSLQTNE